ncbi:hypothetical protein [Polaribacter aestuariivivens]|uniref:hypothetical protein n=1 Tax=Polaribacter aestuariivivens TaxID=2304626 RepID=UPI003F497690
MKTLFNQILDDKYLPCGVHEEFAYVVWRDKKRLKELLYRITICDVKPKNLKLAKDIVEKMLKEYET